MHAAFLRKDETSSLKRVVVYGVRKRESGGRGSLYFLIFLVRDVSETAPTLPSVTEIAFEKHSVIFTVASES